MEQSYPQTMKSLQCMQKGYDHVKLVADAPTPKITGNNDDYFVIIKNLAASINPVDYKACDYDFGFIKYPYKIGLDSCGLIVACGPKVDKNAFVPNKTIVYFHGNLSNTEAGALSEYTKHDSRLMTVLPESLFQNKNADTIYQEFAAIPTVAFTAYQAIVSKLKLPIEKENYNKQVFKPMKYILVTAAAGGVGSFCVQFLKMYKDVVGDNSIRIIGTCSGKNAEFVKQQGATDVIDYNTQNITEEVKKITGGKGLDAWIDNIGEDSCKEALSLLRHQGELVCIVGIGAAFANGGAFFAKAPSVHLVALGWIYQSGDLELMSEVKYMGDKMLQYYQKNQIKVSIQEVFSIQDSKKALDLNKQGHVRGKVVVKF